MTVKVTSNVSTYDDNATPSINVRSHWNRKNMVVLNFGDEERTVCAAELIKAINNATNT